MAGRTEGPFPFVVCTWTEPVLPSGSESEDSPQGQVCSLVEVSRSLRLY